MEQSLKAKMPSVDDCCYYLAQGTSLYPTVQDHYLDKLTILQHRDKVCLIPSAIFECFNRRIRRKIAA
jgi:hypothetical protein